MIVYNKGMVLVILLLCLFTITSGYHQYHYKHYHYQYRLNVRNDESSSSSTSSLSALSTASEFITRNVISVTNSVLTNNIVKNITSSIVNTMKKNNTIDNYIDYDNNDDEGQFERNVIKYDKDRPIDIATNTNSSINRGLWKGKLANVNTTTTTTTNTTSASDNNSKTNTMTENMKYDNNNKTNDNIITSFFGYPRKVITGLFNSNNNNNSNSIVKRTPTPDSNNNNEPKGLLNIIGRSARRRLLNLFDRQTSWNKVVDRDDGNEGSKYISMPQIRKMKPTFDDNYNNNNDDNTKAVNSNSIFFKLRSGLANVGSPIINLLKKDTTNSYSYYDQKNIRMLPSSKVRISDIKRNGNRKGLLSRIGQSLRFGNKKVQSDYNNINNDAIAAILSTTPKPKEMEIIENDKTLLSSLQSLSSRLMPFQKNDNKKTDNSVVSFSITKTQYNTPLPIEEIRITTSEAIATPTMLQNVGNFGRNSFNGLRSVFFPESVIKNVQIDSPSVSDSDIMISNELTQKLTTNYQPKEMFIKRAEEVVKEVAPVKTNKMTAILQAAFPFLSKNVRRVIKTGSSIKELTTILNNTITSPIGAEAISDLSTSTYFNKNNDIVDQNAFTLETNAYNSSFLDYPRKVLSTIYDSWNLETISTYSEWAKQAFQQKTSAQKTIVDDINSLNEAGTAPMETIGDTDASFQKTTYALPVISTNIARQSVPVPDINDDKYERPIDFKSLATIDRPLPRPTKSDFAYLAFRRILIAVSSSKFVSSQNDAEVFLREIGLKSLLIALTQASPTQSPDLRLQALQGLNNLLQQERKIAVEIVKEPNLINALCDIIEVPFNFFSLRSQVDKQRDLEEQYEAISLLFRMVRISDIVTDILKEDARLRKIMIQIAQTDDNTQQGARKNIILQPGAGSFPPPISVKQEGPSIFGFGQKDKKKSSNSTIILDYPGIARNQMCKVIVGAIGATQWKPKQPGQKGLRILSFDGGGTRGVLSVAIMRELMKRVGKNPIDVFDIICGTSTGGIVAVLLGAKGLGVPETEFLYDEFIDKVFGKKSSVKLVTEQASYDELEFENILSKRLGDEQFIDSIRNDCAKVFCVSTKVNTIPTTQIWRNYNYPSGQKSRYEGSMRVNTMTAVRATTAAPTFFVPIQFEGNLYCDGALVANNPTAIALQEAKQLFPGIPIETVVSIGTGTFTQTSSSVQSMGWDLLISQVIAGAVDTEDIHELLRDLLPDQTYFRFNPRLNDNLNIDEKDKVRLNSLKNLALDYFDTNLNNDDVKKMEKLIMRLKK